MAQCDKEGNLSVYNWGLELPYFAVPFMSVFHCPLSQHPSVKEIACDTNLFIQELHLFITSFVTDNQQRNVSYFGKTKILAFFISPVPE